jgi:hypothetical protein
MKKLWINLRKIKFEDLKPIINGGLLFIIIYFSGTLFWGIDAPVVTKVAWVLSIVVFELVKYLMIKKAKGYLYERSYKGIVFFALNLFIYLLFAVVSITATIGSASLVIQAEVEKADILLLGKGNQDQEMLIYDEQIKQLQDQNQEIIKKQKSISATDDWSINYFNGLYESQIKNNREAIQKAMEQKAQIIKEKKDVLTESKEDSSNRSSVSIFTYLGSAFKQSSEAGFYAFRLVMLVLLELGLAILCEPMRIKRTYKIFTDNFTKYLDVLYEGYPNNTQGDSEIATKLSLSLNEVKRYKKFLKMTASNRIVTLIATSRWTKLNFKKEELIEILKEKEGLLYG